MLDEFKDFINRGNVVDLAVAVVLGAAFAPVVTAVVDSLLMPIIGAVVGQPNFDDVGVFLDGQASLGVVITAVVNFLLVALALFFVVRAYNTLQGPDPEELTPSDSRSEEATLLAEIRDELVARSASDEDRRGSSGGE